MKILFIPWLFLLTKRYHIIFKNFYFSLELRKSVFTQKFSGILKPRWAHISQWIEWAWKTLFRTIRSRVPLSQSEWILLSILKLKKSKFYINRYIISINTIKRSVQNQNVTTAMRQIYVNKMVCHDMSPNIINAINNINN